MLDHFSLKIHPVIAASVLSLMIGVSCGKRPEGVLSDSEMTDVLADMRIAEAYGRVAGGEYGTPSGSNRLTDRILSDHNISKEQYDSTLAWYSRNLDVYYKLYEKVDKRLEQKEKHYLGATVTAASQNDADNLWPYGRMAIISPLSPSQSIVFSIDAPEKMQPGDRLRWQLRLDRAVAGKMLLGTDYNDGSSSFRTFSTQGNRNVELSLQTDSTLQVKRIFGYLRLDSDKELPVWADSISLTTSGLDRDYYQNINYQMRYRQPSTGRDRDVSKSDTTGVKSVTGNVADSVPDKTHHTGPVRKMKISNAVKSGAISK